MSELDELHGAADRLTREIEVKRRSISATSAAVRQSRIRFLHAVDQLGLDLHGRPLPIGPLVWALVGGLAALVALFLTYLTGLLTLQYNQPDSDAWVVFVFNAGSLALAGFTLVYSARQGAGGSARAVLRPMTYVLIAACGVALAVVFLIRRPF